MNSLILPIVLAVALAVISFVGVPPYPLHIMIIILIWSFTYTGWSLMGRFGLVSLGHGAFMGIGAYVTALLWNYAELTPWIGIPIALACAALLAVIVGYPCFKFKITGHYFALVTLALTEVVRQVVVATRDYTGGSLGFTPDPKGNNDVSSLMSLQFDTKEAYFLIAIGVWMVGLLVWRAVDRSMMRYALDAISEDEDSASASGINVTREKLKITVLSAIMTAFGGAMYTQYQLFISPDTVSGLGISLQIVFAVVAGGIFTQFGPTFGAIITLLLAEILRVYIGTDAVGLDNAIYGIALVLFIVFLPKGILGGIIDAVQKALGGGRRSAAPAE
ncbi:MAG: branched-chain amino acid ABC transporter permease [Alphaproteobacteria bacterium]|nr:branched-chain amino acid ABC transporter permease [Alphaproteobacteria bacterium]MCB9929825.1 branched-chain amino acid ABC transporter permease [Alphaproteobacteria bacterium]